MKWLLCIFAVVLCTACGTNTRRAQSPMPVAAPMLPCEEPPQTPSPTSIGGITPGKTTVDELKSLISNNDKTMQQSNVETMTKGDGKLFFVNLRCLNNKSAILNISNHVVYKVDISVNYDPEIVVALVKKYGKPEVKKGAIKIITCQSWLGASVQGYGGREQILWKPSNGIQAYIERAAYGCAQDIENLDLNYVVEHIETVQAMEATQAAQRDKAASDRVDKVKGGL